MSALNHWQRDERLRNECQQAVLSNAKLSGDRTFAAELDALMAFMKWRTFNDWRFVERVSATLPRRHSPTVSLVIFAVSSGHDIIRLKFAYEEFKQ
jgi:hypothetical protein